MKRKVTDISLFVIFVLFAIVQFNDPDPLLWGTIYTVIALIVLFSSRVFYALVVQLLIAVLTIYGLFFVPDLLQWIKMGMPSIAAEMKTEQPHIELVREFFGVVISVVVLLFVFIRWRKEQPQVG